MSLGQVPVVERIARELFRRLETMIRNESLNTPVSEVVRPRRLDETSPRHRQIMLTEQNHSRVPDLDCPGNPPAIAKEITFNIRCHLINEEKSCTPIDTLVHMFAADVESVVVGDDPQWYTFDGNAMKAEWQTEEPITGDGAIDGVNLPLTVTYRHSEGNPYQKRG